MSDSSKIILISGASSGIGEATARHLATLGHKVVLGARRTDRVTAIAAEIAKAGGDALPLALDVTRREVFTDFADKALEHYGRIDVLVNNAGVMPLSLVSDLRTDEWDQMIDVNIRGVLNGLAAVLPAMTRQTAGHIINLGSVAAHRVDPTAAVYCATKYAVRALTEGLRQETKDIRVTLVSPGLTRTELFDGMSASPARDYIHGLVEEVAIAPHAIAEAIAFAIAQPHTVDINEIIVRPTAQVV